MGYGMCQGDNMWPNYPPGYNNGYPPMDGGGPGYMGPMHGGMEPSWWGGHMAGQQGEGIYRSPHGIGGQAPWPLKNSKRPDRRGPGRPRLSSTKGPTERTPPGGDGRPRGMMSPVHQFPSPFGSPPMGQLCPGESPQDMLPPPQSSPIAGTGGQGKKRSTGSRPANAANDLMENNPGAMAAAAQGVTVPSGSEGKVTKGGNSATNNKKRYVCEICQKRYNIGCLTNCFYFLMIDIHFLPSGSLQLGTYGSIGNLTMAKDPTSATTAERASCCPTFFRSI